MLPDGVLIFHPPLPPYDNEAFPPGTSRLHIISTSVSSANDLLASAESCFFTQYN